MEISHEAEIKNLNVVSSIDNIDLTITQSKRKRVESNCFDRAEFSEQKYKKIKDNINLATHNYEYLYYNIKHKVHKLSDFNNIDYSYLDYCIRIRDCINKMDNYLKIIKHDYQCAINDYQYAINDYQYTLID